MAKPVTFRLEPEATPHCEWETFIGGSHCHKEGTQVLIQDGGPEDQFHWAHLCDEHAGPAFEELT